jgi:hypothetical protein
MAGLNPTATEIQAQAGGIALTLKIYFDKAVSLNQFLLTKTTEELVALGIPEADVALIKTAYADLAYMKWAAFDSSTFVKRLWGMGF